jgi:hypothetical protein
VVVDVPINAGGETVGEQRLFHPRQISLRIGQSGAMGDPDQRAGIIEHIDKQEAEYDHGERKFAETGKIKLQQSRLQ